MQVEVNYQLKGRHYDGSDLRKICVETTINLLQQTFTEESEFDELIGVISKVKDTFKSYQSAVSPIVEEMIQKE